MKRGRGTADDEGRSCPAAATALGVGPFPEGLAAGKGPVGLGISVGAAVGAAMFPAVARVEPGRVGALHPSCLDASTREPELVIVENEVEKLLSIGLAHLHVTAGRHPIDSTAIPPAICVDLAIAPLVDGRLTCGYGKSALGRRR